MQGQGEAYSASIDTSPPNVIQYCIGDSYSQVRKSRPGLFARAVEPMDDGGNNLGAVIGPCLSFARSYMADNPGKWIFDRTQLDGWNGKFVSTRIVSHERSEQDLPNS